jgi:hypothetical protein
VTISGQDKGRRTEMPTDIDRRTLIKGAAVAGAVAWAAPVIIDSVTSPAAAASGTTGLQCSWVYVFFQSGATVYYTGFSKNGVGCGDGSSNNATPICLSCNGVNYTIGTFGSGEGGSVGKLTYGTSACTVGTALPNAAVHADSSACGQYLSASGGVITAKAGVTLLAAIGHPTNTLSGWCPNNTSAGNSINTFSGGSGANCPAS